MSKSLTIGAVADRFGVDAWKVRRLFERGILPPADRVGACRVIDAADLPKVGAALRQAGYLGNENAPAPRLEEVAP
jgi:hypothetical protein